MKLECVSVELIGARLRNHIYVRTGACAEFSGSDVCLNSELLDGINGGLHAVGLEECFVVVHAVQGVVVILAAKAADGNGGSRALKNARSGSHSSRNQHRQLGEASAIERQFHHLRVVYCRCHSGGVGLQRRRNPIHFYALSDVSNLEAQVNAKGLIDIQLDTGLDFRAKALQFGLNFVGPRRKSRNRVAPPSLVVTTRAAEVASFVTVTATFGIAAPDSSVTLPRMVPSEVWAGN